MLHATCCFSGHLLGAMQPSLRSVYKYLSNRVPQGKVHSYLARTSSPWDSIGICKIHTACWLFSLLHCWFVGRFLVLSSQSHIQNLQFFLEILVVFFFFFQIFSPKIQHRIKASQISYRELLLTATPNPRNFSDSTEIVRYIRENNTWSNAKWGMARSIFTIHRHSHWWKQNGVMERGKSARQSLTFLEKLRHGTPLAEKGTVKSISCRRERTVWVWILLSLEHGTHVYHFLTL